MTVCAAAVAAAAVTVSTAAAAAAAAAVTVPVPAAVTVPVAAAVTVFLSLLLTPLLPKVCSAFGECFGCFDKSRRRARFLKKNRPALYPSSTPRAARSPCLPLAPGFLLFSFFHVSLCVAGGKHGPEQ